jgi:Transglutaminase-like superfamily
MALMPEERALLMRAEWLLVKTYFTLPRTQFVPEPAAQADEAQAAGPDPIQAQALRLRAHHVARLVAYAAAVCPVNVACLHRSLVLWQLLQREQIPCKLRIGVHTDVSQAFTAHAWVECHGEPLHEVADLYQQFGAFAEAVVPVRGARATQAQAAP